MSVVNYISMDLSMYDLGHGRSLYWECRKSRSGECKARAVTSTWTAGREVIVFKGTQESSHTDPPHREAIAVEGFVRGVKRKAKVHPEQLPTQLLHMELGGFLDAVLSQLPDQVALAQTIRNYRL